MKHRDLFGKYQWEILKFCNTDFGKEWLQNQFGGKIEKSDKIVKVTPDSFHLLKDIVKNKPIYEATFFCGSPYTSKFGLMLESLELASEANYIKQVRTNIYNNPIELYKHPWVMFSTLTVNPGTGAADGTVQNQGDSVAWSVKRTSNGDTTYTPSCFVEFKRNGSSTNWLVLGRIRTSFNTSSLTSNSLISSAVASVYGAAKGDPDSNSPKLNIYTSNPADPATLANADFQTIGTTKQCDTDITYAGFNTTGYNDFTLNATGLGNINKSGISNFGFREVTYDADGATPTMSSSDADTYFQFDSSAGTNKPKLVVTYTSLGSNYIGAKYW